MVVARLIVILSLLAGLASYAHADTLVGDAVTAVEATDPHPHAGDGSHAIDDERHSHTSGQEDSPLHCGGAILFSAMSAIDHPCDASSPPRDLANASLCGTAPSPRHPPPRV